MIDNKDLANCDDESEAMMEVPSSNIPFIQTMIDNNHKPENTTQTVDPGLTTSTNANAGKSNAGWGGTHMPATASPNKL